MKKLSAALILTTVFLSLSGCSAQDRLNQLLNAGDPQIPQNEAEHPRAVSYTHLTMGTRSFVDAASPRTRAFLLRSSQASRASFSKISPRRRLPF